MIYQIKRGRDIALGGVPEQRVSPTKRPVTRLALLGPDFIGMRPSMMVKVGDHARRGDPLFECKKTPGVIYTSPGEGKVTAINRGENRSFLSLVLNLKSSGKEDQREFTSYKARTLSTLARGEVINLLVESGLWTALRTRPYSKTPSPDSSPPKALFVSALDTHPLSVDPALVISERREDFKNGLTILSLLPEGPLHVVKKTDQKIPVPDGIKVHEFQGPHPAGLVGTHIHFIDPVGINKSVWHMGYQDVIAVGKLFSRGEYSVERTVSLAGPGTQRPEIVQTRLGASLEELFNPENIDDCMRIISGSVLAGRRAHGPTAYLGRYHTAALLLPQGQGERFLGWLLPGKEKTTALLHGSLRSMVPIGAYESVMPLDLLATPLLRALASRDTEGATELGALELDEEDLALCTYICPSKIDFGLLLRENLERIEREG